MKSKRMILVGHVALRAKKKAYRILVGKPEVKRPLGSVTVRVLRSAPMYLEYSRVEEASNISTVALRAVGTDEKELSVWGYNWTTLFLGNINKGNWPSRLGESHV
jgi:hypothetical protein